MGWLDNIGNAGKKTCSLCFILGDDLVRLTIGIPCIGPGVERREAYWMSLDGLGRNKTHSIRWPCCRGHDQHRVSSHKALTNRAFEYVLSIFPPLFTGRWAFEISGPSNTSLVKPAALQRTIAIGPFSSTYGSYRHQVQQQPIATQLDFGIGQWTTADVTMSPPRTGTFTTCSRSHY